MSLRVRERPEPKCEGGGLPLRAAESVGLQLVQAVACATSPEGVKANPRRRGKNVSFSSRLLFCFSFRFLLVAFQRGQEGEARDGFALVAEGCADARAAQSTGGGEFC